ncbi:unnamed protein product [Brachionus calyciflorus]|uniref:Uncharacterized protein n=1 Tax=Brachionus calyciflorus TaxID=104777 RepID=A0A813XPS3_9BILA|nr:unnamed protein product [Brachionus calyciflorus]
MIKSMLDIYRCKTTALLHALNIEPTKMRIKNARINFFLRLLDNEYTKYVILENKQTIFDDICKIVNVNIDDPADIIIEACKIEKLYNISIDSPECPLQDNMVGYPIVPPMFLLHLSKVGIPKLGPNE